MDAELIKARILNPTELEGSVLFLGENFSAYGTIDPVTGQIIDGPAMGQNLRGRILICGSEAGSTVAPWIFLSLRESANLPIALIVRTNVVVLLPACVLLHLPTYDQISEKDYAFLRNASRLRLTHEGIRIIDGFTQN